jgi:hypothetical protein
MRAIDLCFIYVFVVLRVAHQILAALVPKLSLLGFRLLARPIAELPNCRIAENFGERGRVEPDQHAGVSRASEQS